MKINIHYVLSEKAEEECLRINKMICEHIPNCEIDFQLKTYKPHITLFMGEIKDDLFEKCLKQITKMVESLHFSATGQEIEFTPIYFKNNYIMCDVKSTSSFVNDSKMLIDKLSGLMVTPNKYQIANGTSTPHITLGYCDENDLPKGFLESLPTISANIVGFVECSQAGKHGTVLLDKTEHF